MHIDTRTADTASRRSLSPHHVRRRYGQEVPAPAPVGSELVTAGGNVVFSRRRDTAGDVRKDAQINFAINSPNAAIPAASRTALAILGAL